MVDLPGGAVKREIRLRADADEGAPRSRGWQRLCASVRPRRPSVLQPCADRPRATLTGAFGQVGGSTDGHEEPPVSRRSATLCKPTPDSSCADRPRPAPLDLIRLPHLFGVEVSYRIQPSLNNNPVSSETLQTFQNEAMTLKAVVHVRIPLSRH